MICADLVTGFLGSGKTTFIKKYAEYLTTHNSSIGILENDYGAINIDMMLLQDLPEENCDLEMVIGGDYDCHRRRFKTKLISMGMTGFDRVVVEPSGIYDVDEFTDVLCEEPLDRWYRIGSMIAIVDARIGSETLTEESEYLLMTQTACAGILVFSKVQQAAAGEIEKTKALIKRIWEKYDCGVPDDGRFLIKDWDDLTDHDFERILAAGFYPADHIKMMVDRENGYTSLFFMNRSLSPERIRKIADTLFDDPSLGNIIRFKGFSRQEDGSWISINVTKNERDILPCEKGQEVLIVIGENVNKEKLEQLF